MRCAPRKKQSCDTRHKHLHAKAAAVQAALEEQAAVETGCKMIREGPERKTQDLHLERGQGGVRQLSKII